MKIFSDPAALAVRRSLSDLRGADIQISGDDVWRITTRHVKPVMLKGGKVFTDESAVLEWLLTR